MHPDLGIIGKIRYYVQKVKKFKKKAKIFFKHPLTKVVLMVIMFYTLVVVKI